MLTHGLTVVEPGRIEVAETDLDDRLHPHEVLIETEYSIVSAGTEGAGFTGLVKQMPFGDARPVPPRHRLRQPRSSAEGRRRGLRRTTG